jgi:hypothetical protein
MDTHQLPHPFFARRSLLALLVCLIALTLLPQTAHAAAFGLQRLRENTATGTENYIYTDGGTVFAQASIDSGIYYRFTVLDPTGRDPGAVELHAVAVQGDPDLQVRDPAHEHRVQRAAQLHGRRHEAGRDAHRTVRGPPDQRHDPDAKRRRR